MSQEYREGFQVTAGAVGPVIEGVTSTGQTKALAITPQGRLLLDTSDPTVEILTEIYRELRLLRLGQIEASTCEEVEDET